MKQIIFIRHGVLEEPFDSYDGMPLQQLDAIATHRVSPSIDKGVFSGMFTKELYEPQTYTMILHADSPRARQTARAIGEELSIDQLQETGLLNEVLFSPKQLVNEDEFAAGGMQLIRQRLFEASVSGSVGSESVARIYERIRALLSLLTDCSAESIICVTHGFYMRYLELYFAHNHHESATVTVDILRDMTNYTHLDGFAAMVE